MASMLCGAVLALAALQLPPAASAGGFLGAQKPLDLLAELQPLVGVGLQRSTSERVTALEEAMRTTFLSLPKTTDGRLPPSGVRYLLHRVFVERHGWLVKGLDPEGQGWNWSPSAVFAESPDEDLEDIFEQHVGSSFTLRDAAIFAATLESLAHEDSIDRLRAAYRLTNGGVPEQGASDWEVEAVVEMYMMMHVFKLNHSTLDEVGARSAWRRTKKYPGWNMTARWAHDIRREVLSVADESRTAFNTTARVVEEMMDRYGRFQNRECETIKDDMVKMEVDGTGRVRLRDYYKAGLEDGKYVFTMTEDFLRDSGVLDESSSSQRSILIANYMNAPSNCLGGSRIFSTCCINECESLLRPLERHLAAPDAPPERIVELVEQLPSPTVDAPRVLPPALVARLGEIAEHHGGRVPIHGRLFAQWMHAAFPRECPYPHLSGSFAPERAPVWAAKTGKAYVYTKATLRHMVAEMEAAQVVEADVQVVDPLEAWDPEEELHFHDTEWKTTPSRMASLFRCAAFLTMASLMTAAMLQTSLRARQAAFKSSKLSKEKCCV